MILGIGLQGSIYMMSLILPKGNDLIGRTTIMAQVISIIFDLDLQYHQSTEVSIMDGTIKWDKVSILGSISVESQGQGIIQLQKGVRNEQYLIMIVNIQGIIYLINSNDLIITIIAWELFNQSLYLQVGMNSKSEGGLSATIKYFLQSAQTTGFLLLSVTLIYGKTGSTQYDSIGMLMSYPGNEWTQLQMLLTIVFKQGAAPLHNWAPDLYDGIPTNITMWMTTIPKLGIISLLTQQSFILTYINDYSILIGVGIQSLLIGSIGLGSQYKIKRFQAYSGISHLGFILQGYSYMGTTYYLYTILYCITTLCIFGILQNQNIELSDQKDLGGQYKQNPGLTQALSICLFSFIGLPPQGGFYAKLQIQKTIQENGGYSIAIIAILASVISAANYQSVIRIACSEMPKNHIKRIYVSKIPSILISGQIGIVIILLFGISGPISVQHLIS